tara:strand:- start:147 stop:485 length:339 start_codon:yes stop_codon:yes gene_type:complete
MGELITILVISVLLNVAAIWYGIVSARKLLVVSSNLYSLQDEFTAFQAHVEALYETEMYYGDESLKALIDHTKSILDELDKYEDIYMLVVDDEEINEELNLDQTEEEEEEEN